MSNHAKALKNIFNFTKDKVSSNVINASRQKIFNLNEKDLIRLISLINASIDEAYIKSSPELEKSLKSSNEVSDATKTKKKKS